MTNPYPIMSKLDLESVPARGFMGLGRRTRVESELPKANGHQVHVYLTDGGLMVDHGQLRPDDSRVVNARHVSVVDMGRDVPVSIVLTIPSAEASDFTVEVTFACTVVDASRVVRENLHAETALRHYLLNHRRIFQLGLPYKMMQISQVRIDVGAQISAYTTLRPPVISGLEVTMTSVQVHTPEELKTFESTRRRQLMDHMVSAEGMDLSHRRNDLAADHEHERELINQRHAHSIQSRAQQGRHVLQRGESEFTREELAANYEAVGEDAHKVRIWAQARGELSARDVADQMRAEQAAQAQYAQQLAEQRRLDARRDSELDRAERSRADQYERDQRLRLEQRLREDDIDDRDYRRQLTQQEREDRLQLTQQEREERRQLEQRQREDEVDDRDYRRQLTQQQREDRHRREDADREDWRQELEYKRLVEQRLKEHQLEVLRQLRASGGLDMVNVNVERLIADVIGVPVEDIRPQPVSWRNDPALPSEGNAESGEQNRAAADDTYDAEVREEEDR